LPQPFGWQIRRKDAKPERSRRSRPPAQNYAQGEEPDVPIGLDRSRSQTSPLGTTGSSFRCIALAKPQSEGRKSKFAARRAHASRVPAWAFRPEPTQSKPKRCFGELNPQRKNNPGASPEAFSNSQPPSMLAVRSLICRSLLAGDALRLESNPIGYFPSGIDLPFRLQAGSFIPTKPKRASEYQTHF
jgi:hypothetical protein